MKTIALILQTIYPKTGDTVFDLRPREIVEYKQYVKIDLEPLARLIDLYPVGEYGSFKWQLRQVDQLRNLYVWRIQG